MSRPEGVERSPLAGADSLHDDAVLFDEGQEVFELAGRAVQPVRMPGDDAVDQAAAHGIEQLLIAGHNGRMVEQHARLTKTDRILGRKVIVLLRPDPSDERPSPDPSMLWLDCAGCERTLVGVPLGTTPDTIWQCGDCGTLGTLAPA